MSGAVIDSSVWVEILADGPLAAACERELRRAKPVYVPTLVLFEVYRKISSAVSDDEGLSAVAALSSNEVVDLTRDVALLAADLSRQHRLAPADSIVLAHADVLGVPLVTLDNDFAGVANTRVLRAR